MTYKGLLKSTLEFYDNPPKKSIKYRLIVRLVKAYLIKEQIL